MRKPRRHAPCVGVSDPEAFRRTTPVTDFHAYIARRRPRIEEAYNLQVSISYLPASRPRTGRASCKALQAGKPQDQKRRRKEHDAEAYAFQNVFVRGNPRKVIRRMRAARSSALLIRAGRLYLDEAEEAIERPTRKAPKSVFVCMMRPAITGRNPQEKANHPSVWNRPRTIRGCRRKRKNPPQPRQSRGAGRSSHVIDGDGVGGREGSSRDEPQLASRRTAPQGFVPAPPIASRAVGAYAEAEGVNDDDGADPSLYRPTGRGWSRGPRKRAPCPCTAGKEGRRKTGRRRARIRGRTIPPACRRPFSILLVAFPYAIGLKERIGNARLTWRSQKLRRLSVRPSASILPPRRAARGACR